MLVWLRWRLPVILPGVVFVVLVGLWWAATQVFRIDPFFVPAPPDVVGAFAASPGYLLREAGVTAGVVVAGFGLAAFTGVLLAAAFAVFPVVQQAVLPALVALQAVPKVAIAPLLVVWLGFGPEPRIVMVVMISVFPIMVAAAAGFASTPRELSELAASLSASRWQTFTKIRLPWALPQVFVGLKSGITLAVIGAVVAELGNSTSGLGAVIVTAGTAADTPRAFAAITLLAAMSTALFYTVVGAERLLVRWTT